MIQKSSNSAAAGPSPDKDIPMPATEHTAPPDADDDGSLVQGKFVILAIVGLAVAASALSWFYYARLQERPLALWGSRAAELMLLRPMARAYRLAPAPGELPAGATHDGGGAHRPLAIAGERFTMTDDRDISRAPGFSHIRQSLIHDRSFAWDDGPCESSPRWEYAIAFAEGNESAIVAFAFNCQRAALADTNRTASIRPVAAAIEEFLREQFPGEPAPSAAK